MTKTNKNTLKNIWKKPLATILSLSILAGMSNTCLANQKDVQGANEQQIDALNSQNTKTETDEIRREEKTNEKEIREEEFINFKQKVKLYNSLNSLTKSFLAVTGSWDVNGNLTPESEELIKEADTLISQSSELNQLTDEEKKETLGIDVQIKINQKLLRGLSNFPDLSKEEEEALKKSLKYLAAFAVIKQRPI